MSSVDRRSARDLAARFTQRLPSRRRLAAAARTREALEADIAAEQAAHDLTRGHLSDLEQRHHLLAHFRDLVQTTGLVERVEHDPEGLADAAAFLTWVPPGHYYSPVPRMSEVEANAAQLFRRDVEEVEGIDLRKAAQEELLRTLAPYVAGWPFPNTPTPPWRWFAGEGNGAYETGDAMVLHAMLRHLRPRRLVEVGSGFSSCMVLDTNERFCDGSVDLTFVEPYPELLHQLAGPAGLADARIMDVRLQDAPLDLFTSLEAGDVLLVDSTHIAKIGSDVVDLFGRVLPALAPGVVVHIHDVFWPFEYPEVWVREGRAWNELYLVRAFLEFNHEFEVLLFSDWLARRRPELVADQLPGLLEHPGGALWLRRRTD